MIDMLKLLVGKILYGKGYTLPANPLHAALPEPELTTEPLSRITQPYSNAAQVTAARLVQPAPRPQSGCIPLQSWYTGVINDMCHLLIVGNTGDGKTVTLRALQRGIAAKGGQLFLISPKAQRSKDCAAAGYGCDYQAIGVAMAHFTDLLKQRYQDFANGVEDFSPIYITVDEWPTIRKRLKEIAPAFMEDISNMGREAGIHLIILTQSPNCEDLGISGPTRNNFAKVLLGVFARQALPDYNFGNARPAVFSALAGKCPIEVAGLDTIATRPLPKQANYQLPGSDPNDNIADQTGTGLLDFLLEGNIAYQTEPANQFNTSSSEFDNALAAYQAGNTTVRTLAATIGCTTYRANALIKIIQQTTLTTV